MMSRLIKSIALTKICSRVASPMTRAATQSCRNNSTRRRTQRMIDPSNTSVISQILLNLAPRHHSNTGSIKSQRNCAANSSTSIAMFASRCTSPTRLAAVWSVWNAPRSSEGGLRSVSPRSVKMRHESMAAACAGERSLKAPPRSSSVVTSSSAVETSHATRPLSWITLSLSTWPRRRRTVFIDMSLSRMGITFFSRMSFWRPLILVRRLNLFMNALYMASLSTSSSMLSIGSCSRRAEKCSDFFKSAINAGSVTLKSVTASNSLGPRGKRRITSSRLRKAVSMAWSERMSLGVCTRRLLTAVTSGRGNLTTLGTGLSCLRIAGVRMAKGLRTFCIAVAGSQATTTSTLSAVSVSFLPRPRSTLATTPQPQPLSSLMRRPGLRNFAILLGVRTWRRTWSSTRASWFLRW
mmetsp:Transcript_22013/g.70287  ORF Transcript_22013/g.70287 Transcript_22013/m.70287 type:complete len:409 (+) Transcript_22013:84-1310(+)